MSTALSVVFLYAASVIPTAKLALCFLTSLMPWIPLRERGGFVYALMSYAATGAICFFLIPNKLYFAAYILFFGSFAYRESTKTNERYFLTGFHGISN